MKKLFIFILFFSPVFIMAQNNDTIYKPEFTYAELVGTAKFLSTKVNIIIDFGEERGFFEDTRLRNEATGKLETFNSMVDALNYMGAKGWEFVQAYVITFSSNQNVYHWLLKKKIK